MNFKNKSIVIALLLAMSLLVCFAAAYANEKSEAPADKTYPPMTAVHGGPDGGGYYFIDSDDEAMNAPRYEWVDISGIGTPEAFPNGIRPGDDAYSNPISLGFDFDFYGNTYNSIVIDVNGYITFSSITQAYYSNVAIPNSALPNDIIAVEWDDMQFTSGVCYYYYDEANRRFIVSWTGWEYYSDPTNPHDFQVILNESDNSIVMQYGDNAAGFQTSATVGIENASGSIGTQYLYNQAGLHSEMAIYFGLQGPIFGTNNVGPTSILAPGAYGQVGTPITPSVVYRNIGSAPATFPARVIIKNGANVVYNQTVQITNLPSNENATATFPAYTPTEAAIFDVFAISELSNDENRANDTLRTTFQTFALIAYYDFEAAGVFTPTGDWEWGTPTSGPMAAHSGVNLWGTTLGGPYPANDLATLTTTPFGLGNNAVMSFWQWYDTEANFDGCNVKISTDGGNTWVLITPVRGYDSNTPNAANPLYPDPIFTGHIAAWENITFDLSEYGGLSVLFRLDFGSDGSVQYPGWYIDDFTVLGGGGVEPGYVSGIVSIAGAGTPINGAVVNSGAVSYTTGADGKYTLALYPGTYDVTATALHHNTVSHSATIVEDETTTVNFALTTPQINVDASPINAQLRLGQIQNFVRNISNPGDGALEYRIDLSYDRLRVHPVRPPSFSNEPVIARDNSAKTNQPDNAKTFKANDSYVPQHSLITEAGDEMFYFDAQAATSDNQLLGAVFANGHFWVNGGNAGTDPNNIYEFDREGNLLSTYSQGTSSWGWLDLGYDGTYIYGVDYTTDEISQFDPASGTIVGTIPNDADNAGLGITYDPTTDHFWGCYWFGADLVEFDRDGNMIASYPQGPLTSIFGIAWDNYSADGPWLWVFSQETSNGLLIAQFDPRTGSYTGVEYTGVDRSGSGLDISGGCEISIDYNPAKVALVTLTQGNISDGVSVYEIAPYSRWLTVDPMSGSIPAGGNQNLTMTVDLTGPGLDTVTALHANVAISNNSATQPIIALNVQVITGIEGAEGTLPIAYNLSQNYPNPFNARTQISFALPTKGNVELSVYNVMGQKVSTLVAGEMPAGYHQVNWDASNVASGVYFYKLTAGNYSKIEQMTLLK